MQYTLCILPLLLAALCPLPLAAAAAPTHNHCDAVKLMRGEVEAYINSEEDLADDPTNANLLRDNLNAVDTAAARYEQELNKLAKLLTTDAETYAALMSQLHESIACDLGKLQSGAVWNMSETQEPARLGPTPSVIAAIPSLGNGRCGSTAETNVQMHMAATLWQNYVDACYTQLYDLLAGESPYPINIYTGATWAHEGDGRKVGEQLKKVHEAWVPYCAAVVKAATPGMESARFWGTGISAYADAVRCTLCADFEHVLVAILNPAFEPAEEEMTEGAPADDAAVYTAPVTLKGKTVVLDYTSAEFRSCGSAWLAFNKVPKTKKEQEKPKALYCFADCYGMAPKATRNLTPITENGEGGIYTYKVVGPDTATITVDMAQKLHDNMEWARIYTIHFTSPTEGEATEDVVMGDSEGGVRNIRVYIK